MKKKYAVVALLLLSAAALALSYTIHNNFMPDNVAANISAVNLEPLPVLYAHQHPNERGTLAQMNFQNYWYQTWSLAFNGSTIPWAPVAGTEVNLNAVCRKIVNDTQHQACLNQQVLGSPIVVDLGKNGIKLGNAGVGVVFDINADGKPYKTQWVRPNGDEAFLALDRNENGIIDDGSELFGNHTLKGAADGYAALAQYDDNKDGRITGQDEVWPRLLLWHDENADGVSTAQELTTLDANGLMMLSVIPSVHSGVYDKAGNWLPYWGWARSREKPSWVATCDVWFARVD